MSRSTQDPHAAPDVATTSVDAIFEGQVRLEQHLRGYRFNVDSVLLAAFANAFAGRRLLDVGTGVGIVGLALAHLRADTTVTLVEVQPSLAALARANIARNHADARVELLEGDIRTMAGRTQHFELATINPPYFVPGAGRQSPDGERARARHQLHGTLNELMAGIDRLLYARARLCVVYPAAGLGALMSALERCERRALLVQPVLPYEGADASIVLVAAQRSPAHDLTLLPPLILHDDARRYTPEAADILRTGRWARVLHSLS